MPGGRSNDHMILISNDNFIVGLLTGYSIANNFTLKCTSWDRALFANKIDDTCKAIVIDLRTRMLAPSLMKDYLDSLQNIHKQYAVPICAITRHNASSIYPLPEWIDEYVSENFIDGLDSYICKYINNSEATSHERRNDIRRMITDRRIFPTSFRRSSATKLIGESSLYNQDTERFSLGDFEINYNFRAVYLKGRDLELSNKEFELFILLAEDLEHVCTTEKIIKHLWPNTHRATKSDLYQYMHLLRKKVEQDPENPHWILTVKGVGYQLCTRSHSDL